MALVKEIQREIPLQGIDSVKAALIHFQNGSPGSRSVITESSRGQDGLYAIGLLLIENKIGGAFITNLLSKVETALRSGRNFEKAFDYDGPGPFHKTTVKVRKDQTDPKSDSFLLSLNAAYVGDRPEIGLAENLEIERALCRINVDVPFSKKADQFAIDLQPVLDTLAGVVCIGNLTAETCIASMIYQKTPRDEISGVVTIPLAKGLAITLSFHNVDDPCRYEDGCFKLMWHVNGTVVSGKMGENYGDKTVPFNPICSLSIGPIRNEPFEAPFPMIQMEDKTHLRDLAQRIASAFP